MLLKNALQKTDHHFFVHALTNPSKVQKKLGKCTPNPVRKSKLSKKIQESIKKRKAIAKKNAVKKLAKELGISARQVRSIAKEALQIMSTKKFKKIVREAKKGNYVQVFINGRRITSDPGSEYIFSGFTEFPTRGFSLGPEAFKSKAELRKTIFHEIFRLRTSATRGGRNNYVGLATSETQQAVRFADEAFDIFL